MAKAKKTATKRQRPASSEGGDTIVTTSVLAGWLGVNARTVGKLVERGVLDRAGRGRFRLQESVRRYIEHLRASLNVRSEDAPDLATARAQLAVAQRKVQELKAAEMAGKLVRRDAVEEAFGQIAAALRSSLLTMPSRARGRIPHLTAADAQELEGLIRDILRDVPHEAGLPAPVHLPAQPKSAQRDDGADED